MMYIYLYYLCGEKYLIMKEFNPFLISGYRDKEHFCDRDNETELIISHVKNQRSVSLFSHRRLGKTGLLKHVFETLKSDNDIRSIYIDIQWCLDMSSFIDVLATEIYNLFPVQSSSGKKITTALRSLRPVISFDDLTGAPSLSLKTEQLKEKELSLRQLLNFLNNLGIQILLVIDEFQQILEFQEKNVEAILRSQMQELNNVQFIFCGSNQKMMHEIFNNAKRPFFASCTSMHLDYIAEEKYKSFIRHHFRKANREIHEEALDFICSWTLLHTYYTQYFCNFLYASKIKVIDLNKAQLAAAQVLEIHENSFYQYRNLLTSGQWEVLKAVAKEVNLYQPNARKFIQSHGLGTPASVSRTMESLIKKEMIFHVTSASKSYYEVYDKFLMRYLSRI